MAEGTYRYYIVGSDFHKKALSLLAGSEDIIPDDDKPMPFLVEYSEAEKDSLKEFKPYAKILYDLDKDYVANGSGCAKDLVLAAVEALAPAVSTLWPHRTNVYALLKSGNVARRIITMSLQTLHPYVRGNPQPFFVMCSFPSVVHAIIWIIAGGNENLKEWGLDEWVGVPEAPRTASATVSNSQRQTIDLTSSDDDNAMEVEATCDNPDPPINPSSISSAKPCAPSGPGAGGRAASPSSSASRTRSTSHTPTGDAAPANSVAVEHRSFVPPGPGTPFISTSIMQKLDPAAVYTVKFHPAPPVPTLHLQPVKVSNDEVKRMQTHNPYINSELTDDIVFYLHCHGWTHSQRMMTTIETAVTLETKHAPFVILLTNAGMPLLQAEYLVRLLCGRV